MKIVEIFKLDGHCAIYGSFGLSFKERIVDVDFGSFGFFKPAGEFEKEPAKNDNKAENRERRPRVSLIHFYEYNIKQGWREGEICGRIERTEAWPSG